MSWDRVVAQADEAGDARVVVALLAGRMREHEIDLLLLSGSWEVKTAVWDYLWKRGVRGEEQFRFLGDFAVESLEAGLVNERRMGRREAGEALRLWFWRLWGMRGAAREMGELVRLREAMGWLCLCGGVVREVVLLVVLEHLFRDAGVAGFFEGWKGREGLGEVYGEAVGLARGFD